MRAVRVLTQNWTLREWWLYLNGMVLGLAGARLLPEMWLGVLLASLFGLTILLGGVLLGREERP